MNASDLIQVSMGLPKENAEYADKLREILHAKNNAQVVGIALDLMNLITNSLSKGGDLLIRKNNGDMYKINIPGIDYAIQ